MQNSTEIGYVLTKDDLNNGNYDLDISSIKQLGSEVSLNGEELLTGPQSLGAFLENEGYHAVPSPRQPAPGDN